jgi:hypothetical protein
VPVNQFNLISQDRRNFALHSMEITFEMHVDPMVILHLLINESYWKNR